MEILIIHGLNNTTEVFKPLGNELVSLGHNITYLTLLGHNAILEKDLSWKKEKENISNQLKKLDKNKEYFIIAFSQGALVFQNAISENLIDFKIKGQVLLAPSLKLHNQKVLEWITNKTKANLITPSRTPKDVSQFDFLYASYYKVLFEELEIFNKASYIKLNEVPTLIIIDPDDELVSTKSIREVIYKNKMTNWSILPFPRKIPPTKMVFSKHHTLFFPTYFEDKDWSKLITILNTQILK